MGAREILRRVVDGINTVASFVCYALLVVIVAITCAQVFLRFVLNSPTSWSEEIALLCLIWFGMIAIAIGIRRHEHVAIGALRDALPRPLGITLDYLAYLLVAVFMLVVVVYGRDVIALAGAQILPASGLSKEWLYMPTVVGGSLGVFNALANIALSDVGSAPITAMETKDAD